MQLAKLAVVPVVVLTVSIFAVLIFGFSEAVVLNPPYLLFTLNLVFWTIAAASILLISAKSFLDDGSLTVLLISTSILIFAASVIISGLEANFSGDYSVALSNPCLLVASIVQFISSVLSFKGKEETRAADRKKFLGVAYIGALLFVGGITALAVSGSLPIFFTTSGPTLLRQLILGSAVAFLGVAFGIFGAQYMKSKSPSLLLYALSIALFSIGLFSAFEVKVLGDIPTWLGRATLYAGTLYLTGALVKSRGSALGISSQWAETFRSSQQQFENLFSRMLNGFSYQRIVVDDGGKPVDYVFLAINDAFEKMTGLRRENVIGRRVTDVLPGIEKDPADWIRVYGKVALTGEPAIFENYAQPLNKWYSVSAYSPKKGYFVSIFDDITERKKAEKEIASLAKFPLENPGVVLRVDQEGIIMFANPAASDFLKEWQTKVGEQVPKFLKQKVGEALASETKIEFEENLGEETFSFLIAPIIAEGYANLYGRSITKRKKAEKKLEEYTKNLEVLVAERTSKLEASALYSRSLIEASLDPLVTISAEGKITDVNQATERATGCSREEMIGSDFSDYFTEPEKAAAGYRSVFREGFVQDYPLSIKHKSGKVTQVLYNASVYRNAAGEVQGIFAAARDVTERKNLEKQLKEKERLATIGITAGMVGHDIRNPLQAITGDVYLAKSDLASMPEGEAKKNLSESLVGIEKNVEYINKIVQDLQDYARPINPVIKEFNLQNLCEEVLLKSSAPKNVRSSCRVEEDAKQIVADPELLRRVVSNLVTNAVQSMPKGGKLAIRAYRDRGDTVIEVQDTGVGIPEEVKPRLFGPLFTTKSKGQGFGLAVVKRVTESMNGTVTFESREGKGTVFTVRLPHKQGMNGEWSFK